MRTNPKLLAREFFNNDKASDTVKKDSKEIRQYIAESLLVEDYAADITFDADYAADVAEEYEQLVNEQES